MKGADARVRDGRPAARSGDGGERASTRMYLGRWPGLCPRQQELRGTPRGARSCRGPREDRRGGFRGCVPAGTRRGRRRQLRPTVAAAAAPTEPLPPRVNKADRGARGADRGARGAPSRLPTRAHTCSCVRADTATAFWGDAARKRHRLPLLALPLSRAGRCQIGSPPTRRRRATGRGGGGGVAAPSAGAAKIQAAPPQRRDPAAGRRANNGALRAAWLRQAVTQGVICDLLRRPRQRLWMAQLTTVYVCTFREWRSFSTLDDRTINLDGGSRREASARLGSPATASDASRSPHCNGGRRAPRVSCRRCRCSACG